MASTALTAGEATKLAACETVIDEGFASFVEVGKALAEIKDGKLYRVEHKTFEAYCKARWSFEKSYANKIVAAHEARAQITQVKPKTGTNGTQKLPITERQARPLTSLESPEQKAEAWQKATEAAGGEQPTAKQVKEAVVNVRAAVAAIEAAKKPPKAGSMIDPHVDADLALPDARREPGEDREDDEEILPAEPGIRHAADKEIEVNFGKLMRSIDNKARNQFGGVQGRNHTACHKALSDFFKAHKAWIAGGAP